MRLVGYLKRKKKGYKVCFKLHSSFLEEKGLGSGGGRRPHTVEAGVGYHADHVRFVAHRVTMGRVFLRALRFSIVGVTAPSSILIKS